MAAFCWPVGVPEQLAGVTAGADRGLAGNSPLGAEVARQRFDDLFGRSRDYVHPPARLLVLFDQVDGFFVRDRADHLLQRVGDDALDPFLLPTGREGQRPPP